MPNHPVPPPADIERVLSVSAHPDDSEFFAGGTLAQLAAGGATVVLVVCTDGARGGHGVTDIARVREQEQARAAEVLGIGDVRHLGYRDGDLTPSPELRDTLIRIIREVRPQVVLGHHPQTVFTRYGERVQMGHSDHRASAGALLDAIYPRAGSPHFLPGEGKPYLPEELWLFDCAQPDYLVDVSAGFPRKLAALAEHASQGGGGTLRRAAQRVATLLGSELAPAEAFVRLRLR